MLFLFQFPEFGSTFGFRLLLPVVQVEHILLVLLFQFLQLVFLHGYHVFLFLDARLVFGFQLLFQGLFLLLQTEGFSLDFRQSLDALVMFRLIVVDGADVALDVLQGDGDAVERCAFVHNLRREVGLPEDGLVAQLTDVFFPSLLVLLEPALQGALAVFQEGLQFVHTRAELQVLGLQLHQCLVLFLQSLLQLFFPLQGKFLDDELGVVDAVLLAHVQARVRLDTVFQLLLLGFEESLLAAQLHLVVEGGQFVLLAAALRMQLLRELFVFLVKRFGSRFVLTAGFFDAGIERVVQSLKLLDFGLVDAVPLLVEALDERLVLGRDFCVVRGKDALLFLQSLLLVLPFFLTGRTLHDFFYLAAGILLFLLLCFLQFVVQDGQRLLHLVAALARLFLQLLTAGEEGGTCLLGLVLLFLGLGQQAFGKAVGGGQFAATLHEGGLLA
ncbi:unknown [Phocaeicola plebeius CAG:211]|uniref:Uncharacterized protein n=1 Tax=Phocaeicola plebeius CAG:211 TaxID=1263052 RepID=R5VTF4_9BACT|nr:unknown [Phocaeicola plebeius CAG:211]